MKRATLRPQPGGVKPSFRRICTYFLLLWSGAGGYVWPSQALEAQAEVAGERQFFLEK